MLTNPRHAQTILLPDGRKLGFAEYGDPTGFPIMLFHGTPGCRLWFTEDDPVAHALGLRLIATDRPGYGLSDPQAGRKILDWPADVAALAEELGLTVFSVLGISGGGIYAAACAYKLSQQLQTVALVATMAPFDKGKAPATMCRQNRLAFYLSRKFPWLLKLSYQQQKRQIEKDPGRYQQALQAGVGHLCEQDRQILQSEDVARVLVLHMKEALRQGPAEAVTEPALLASDWGFAPSDIHFPIQLWHGTADTLAPFKEIRKLEALLPNCTTHYQQGAGHFLTENKEVWTALLKGLAGK